MSGVMDAAWANLFPWGMIAGALLFVAGLGILFFRSRGDSDRAGSPADGMRPLPDIGAEVLETAALPSLSVSVARDAAPVLQPSPSLAQALGLNAGREISLDTLADRLDPESAEAFRQGVGSLLTGSETFNLTVKTAAGDRAYALGAIGRTPSWHILFHDVTALSERLKTADSEVSALRKAMDDLPFPVWRRTADLSLSDCNRRYCEALETTREQVLEGSLEFLGQSQIKQARALSEEAQAVDGPVARRSHVVVAGARRLMELTEWRLSDGSLLGMASDKTELEELQSELKRHLEAQAEVLENLGTAIAIFGADLHLNFYNSAYLRLWDVPEDIFQGEPHIGDVLEALREHRRLPEQSDFPAYKQDLIKTYGTLIESREELVHLPDGRTLRLLVVPYPLGGVLLSYEDVTDRLAMERSYNTLIEVQRETLDHLYEGVAVYGADGLLKLSNPAFSEIWKIPPEALAGQPHVRDLVERTRGFLAIDESQWPDYAERVVAETTEPAEAHGRRERADGTVIDWARVPLPDGAVLYTFVDVTDSLKVERALRERNEALETADRLKSEFIANVSYELRTPLNAIIGFAEILTNQFFGSLNERQLEYSAAIVESSQRLIALINDILDLASMEAGYLQIDLAPTDAYEVIESVYNLGKERAHNRDLVLDLKCREDIGSITVDARRLKQALFNLLSTRFSHHTQYILKILLKRRFLAVVPQIPHYQKRDECC